VESVTGATVVLAVLALGACDAGEGRASLPASAEAGGAASRAAGVETAVARAEPIERPVVATGGTDPWKSFGRRAQMRGGWR
jgi:hypothetical protein